MTHYSVLATVNSGCTVTIRVYCYTSSDTLFYCFCCYKLQKEQVSSSVNLVQSLKDELLVLKDAAATAENEPHLSSTQQSYASVSDAKMVSQLHTLLRTFIALQNFILIKYSMLSCMGLMSVPQLPLKLTVLSLISLV